MLCIHSSFDAHLACIHFLAVVNKAGTNISVRVPIRVHAFISSGHMPV